MKVAQGNQAAFKELFDKYQNYIFDISIKILKSNKDSADIIQEVFLKIWLNRDKLLKIENFKAYIATITSNHIYSLLRKKLKENSYMDYVLLIQDAKNGLPDKQSPTGELIFLQSDLEKAMSHLTPQQKKIFHLSRIDGLTHHDIADKLKISKETVKKHVMASLRVVRKQMSKYEHVQDIFILFILLVCK